MKEGKGWSKSNSPSLITGTLQLWTYIGGLDRKMDFFKKLLNT